MYLAVHAAAGVAINRSAGRFGIPLAVLSHPVLDRTPNWHNLPTPLPLEIVLNVLAIALLWRVAPKYRWGLLAGMALDVEQIGKGLFGWPIPVHAWFWGTEWLGTPFWSVLIQCTIVMLVLWPFARPGIVKWFGEASAICTRPATAPSWLPDQMPVGRIATVRCYLRALVSRLSPVVQFRRLLLRP